MGFICVGAQDPDDGIMVLSQATRKYPTIWGPGGGPAVEMSEFGGRKGGPGWRRVGGPGAIGVIVAALGGLAWCQARRWLGWDGQVGFASGGIVGGLARELARRSRCRNRMRRVGGSLAPGVQPRVGCADQLCWRLWCVKEMRGRLGGQLGEEGRSGRQLGEEGCVGPCLLRRREGVARLSR